MFKHKDFKEIVILDFGISNFYKENKSTKIFGLTPYYCPPEIKHYTLLKISPKADIFSFGMYYYYYYYVIVYSMKLFQKKIPS